MMIFDLEVMFCTKCGFRCEDGMKYCPNCGEMLTGPGPSVVPVQKPKPSPPPPPPPPAPKCEDKEEETFYQSNKNTLKGLKDYCARYPKGFYFSDATDEIRSIEASRKEDARLVKKILKTIALIILFPIFLFSSVLSRFGKVYWLSNLINWYKKDE